MKAIEVAAFGGPEVLRVVERDAPVPGPGEVLIRVEAVGLNWSDLMQRAGTYPGGPTPPFIAGQEAAGTVVAIGEDVTWPLVGAQVCVIGSGLAAELAVVPVNRCIDWKGSAEQRAALPIALLTANAVIRPMSRHSLVRDREPRPRLIVHAAAGAFGHIATQVARQLGWWVLGTASPAKQSLVEADVICGYDDLRSAAGDGVDVVIDGVGGRVFRDSLTVLKPGGEVIIIGASSGEPQQIDATKLVLRSHSVRGFHLRQLLADEYKLEVAIEACRGLDVKARVTTMPMADIAQAHARLQAREIAGKLVVTW